MEVSRHDNLNPCVHPHNYRCHSTNYLRQLLGNPSEHMIVQIPRLIEILSKKDKLMIHGTYTMRDITRPPKITRYNCRVLNLHVSGSGVLATPLGSFHQFSAVRLIEGSLLERLRPAFHHRVKRFQRGEHALETRIIIMHEIQNRNM